MRSARAITTMFAFFALVASACGSGQPESLASTEGSDTPTTVAQVAEATSDDATPLEPFEWQEPFEWPDTSAPIADIKDPTDEEVASDDSSTTSTEPEVQEPPACEAPELQGHWVDVAVDDPDGGLNVRSGASVSYNVVFTFSRGKELITRGDCELVDGTEWWLVTTSDGSADGWASSRFLSASPLLTPALGAMVTDVENAELKAETLDELAEKLAVIYGFDGDVVITEVDVEPLDAIGGNATYELTGLKDDSVNGYRVEISWWIDRSADGSEVYGVIAKRIGKQAMCTRGVTEDGLCV